MREALRDVFTKVNIRHLGCYRLQITESDGDFNLPGSATLLLHLKLESDFSVKVLEGPEGNPTGETGSWTMVYD